MSDAQGRSARTSPSACGPRTSTSPTSGQGLAVTVDVVEELGADAYIYGQAKAHLVDAGLDDEEAPMPSRSSPASTAAAPREKGQTVYLKPASRATCTCSTPRTACGSATDRSHTRPEYGEGRHPDAVPPLAVVLTST